MRQALEKIKFFADRRAAVGNLIKGSALIVSAPTEKLRNGSVHYNFRQDSNLYYLTGFEEPESILVFRPGLEPETVLFVRKKDPSRETWDGFRYGPEAAQVTFQMDQTYPIEEFDTQIVELLKGVDSLYYRMFKNKTVDAAIERALINLKNSLGRTGYGILPILDSEELIGECRVIKGPAELDNLRSACDLSSEAHIELMKYVQPGITERELHGFFIYQIMKRGAAREGYGGIFATGANACTLHYVFNDQPLKEKDLLLVDAAGEFNYFTSDITRSYPVNGKFSDAQAEVYEGVLKIQKSLIEMVKPGIPFQTLHETGASMLTDLMLELGLLTGRKEDIMKANQHRKYYPHGIGHFLGMDVHDAGLYLSKKGEPRKIQEGMVFTIEPGLYIPASDQEAGPQYRGIGVRIEDNILVTFNGYEVLTRKCPKEIIELERTIGMEKRSL